VSRPCLDVGIHFGKDGGDRSAENFALEKTKKASRKQSKAPMLITTLIYNIQ